MFARSLLIFVLSFLAMGGYAQNLRADLDNIAQRLNSASVSLDAKSPPTMAELNAIAAELEAVLAQIRQVDREVSAELSKVEADFFAESEDLMKLIGFIVTFEAQPAPEYILHPDGPVASVQANIIVSAFMDELQNQVGQVASRLRSWREIKESEDVLAGSTLIAFENISALRNVMIQEVRGERSEDRASQSLTADALSAVSENLEQFSRGLAKLDQAPKSQALFSMQDNIGRLDFPVAGSATSYRDGLQIFTEDSFVKTPVPGTIRFQSDFLDYGQMVIIEPESNYLVILAGFDAGSVGVGEVVGKGDIVGFFDEGAPQSEQLVTKNLRLPKKTLYVEIRNETAPVDVMDFFREKQN